MLIYLMVNKHNKEILRNFKSKPDFPDVPHLGSNKYNQKIKVYVRLTAVATRAMALLGTAFF